MQSTKSYVAFLLLSTQRIMPQRLKCHLLMLALVHWQEIHRCVWIK